MGIKQCQDMTSLMIGIDYFWGQELNDPNSIWYKFKNIEKEIKRINPKARRLVLALAKSIKFSFMKGKRFFYSQRTFLVEGEKVTQQHVSRAMKILERDLGILFIRIPTSVVCPSCSKNSSGKWIPITLSLVKKFMQWKLTPLGIQLTPFKDQLTPFKDIVDTLMLWIPNENKNLAITLRIPTLAYVVDTYKIYKEFSFFINHASPIPQEILKDQTSLMREQRMDKNNDQSKIIPLPVKVKRYKLMVKEKPTKYVDYGFYPNHFSSLKHIEIQQILGKYLDECVYNDYKPLPEETLELIKAWNSIENPRFRGHKEIINNKSNTFKELQLAVSYRLHSSGYSPAEIAKSFVTFNTLSDRHGRLKYLRDITLLKYLTSEKWFNACVNKDITEAFKETSIKVPEYQLTYDRVINSFTKWFHHNSTKLAKDDIDGNYYNFVNFSKRMVEDHKTLFLKGWKVSKYIDEYFKFLREFTQNWQFEATVKTILGPKLRGQFFRQMRSEPGWQDFGKEQKDVESR